MSMIGNSWSFDKYAFLTARNSYEMPFVRLDEQSVFRVERPRIVREQLHSGVRALMLKIFDTRDSETIWVAQNTNDDGDYNWFDSSTPALAILKEIEEFLSSNPFEILTLILEDCVTTSNGLAKVFKAARLTKYLLPLNKMPQHDGQSWPSVKDMVAADERLIVFTSDESKQLSEGIAYKWNFMMEIGKGVDVGHLALKESFYW
ncbi:hypothetical protein RHSIM_Rhsim07G0253300 [Rhododendron simsii]|uniref:Uncharacterized protein n=1 Tax=Rhododendron simsii TaxID=118357 RepID=A0A834LHR8_RHOSS|nr:hypothetical protein RHSIM_Rhsim07G0253300 [Rhododendron simsii]